MAKLSAARLNRAAIDQSQSFVGNRLTPVSGQKLPSNRPVRRADQRLLENIR
jgi:hypothetical protein